MGAQRERGPLSSAAERLKEALKSKLKRDVEDPLNVSVLRAITLVNDFLRAHSEDPQQWSALQESVKKCLLEQQSSSASTLPAPAPRNPADSVYHRTQQRAAASPLRASSASALMHPHASLSPMRHRRRGSVMADRGRASTADAAQSLTATPGRGGATLSAAALSGLNPAQQVSAVMGVLQGLAPAEVAAELDALYREGPGATRRVLARETVDWTMPKHIIRSKAFVLNAHNPTGDMIRTQDLVAQCAEVQRQQDVRKTQACLRAGFDAQTAELRARRQAECEAKKDMARYMAGVVAGVKHQEAAEKVARLERAAGVRSQYAAQLVEMRDAREEAATAAARETALARMAAEELARQEREDRAARLAANKALVAAQHVELAAALRHKARVLAQEQEDDKRAAREAQLEMDRREAERVAALAKRRAWQQALYERGGGAALEASMEEQARATAERAARQAAELEAKTVAKLAADRARREDDARERDKSLQAQKALREAERREAAEELRRVRAAMDADVAALEASKAAAKAAKKVQQAEARAAMKRALVEENMRQFDNTNTTEAERATLWVHQPVLGLNQRALTALTVPANLNPAHLIAAHTATVAARIPTIIPTPAAAAWKGAGATGGAGGSTATVVS